MAYGSAGDRASDREQWATRNTTQCAKEHLMIEQQRPVIWIALNIDRKMVNGWSIKMIIAVQIPCINRTGPSNIGGRPRWRSAIIKSHTARVAHWKAKHIWYIQMYTVSRWSRIGNARWLTHRILYSSSWSFKYIHTDKVYGRCAGATSLMYRAKPGRSLTQYMRFNSKRARQLSSSIDYYYLRASGFAHHSVLIWLWCELGSGKDVDLYRKVFFPKSIVIPLSIYVQISWVRLTDHTIIHFSKCNAWLHMNFFY